MTGNCHLFVKGFVTLDWTHEDIYMCFKQFGEIVSAKVSIDADHKCKGYGYVQFADPESARKAIEKVSTHLK